MPNCCCFKRDWARSLLRKIEGQPYEYPQRDAPGMTTATLSGVLPACTSRGSRRPACHRDGDRRVTRGGRGARIPRCDAASSEAAFRSGCQGSGAWGGGRKRVSIAPIRCVSTPAKTSDPDSKTRPDASLVNVRETEVSSELRAAAAARALSFYTYPADRSEFSVRAHRNMRIDAEWDAIRAKIAGTDVAFRRSRVTCLVAALDLDRDGVAPGGWAEAGVDANLDPSCFANVAPDGSNARRVILGTLDVNQGVSLPAEELAGTLPRAEDPTPLHVNTSQDGVGTNGPRPGECDRDGTDMDGGVPSSSGSAGALVDESNGTCGVEGAFEGSEGFAGEAGARPMRYRRAYLSNVCVLPAARRTGLGRRLMNRAMRVAYQWGVERLYVHVVADNAGAKTFYLDLGFEVEAEESAAFASGLNRPRRLLLTQVVRDVPESEC